MKNYEKYKTYEEQVSAFEEFCKDKDCEDCLWMHIRPCSLKWLHSEVEETIVRREK